MKLAILLSTLAVAAGFAPQIQPRQMTSLSMSEDLISGTVKWFDTAKGFGFIVPDNGDKDIFVHQTNINVSGFRSLAEGEAVEFKIVTENGKSKAIDVTGPEGTDVKGAPFRAEDDFGEW
eukprot:CAMPEP_0201726984 /NCGR_PEP_ID=MMETSP0593-20130828/10566_1 /ASSEMBLY_ACC=CAM_ASM_000672 /TAXON_ID=267983 /ORGANISM="Skeletonema japonicum, Strain CCMP2506" /LENGTH=119 /DNA_ID=CAMNT_0048218591 /DNA_START=58 /DNA_END=417 /DNA_ORIENTATION=+